MAPEEEEAEPRVEGVDGHNEQEADDEALLLRDGVGTQVRVDLWQKSFRGASVPAPGPVVHHMGASPNTRGTGARQSSRLPSLSYTA